LARRQKSRGFLDVAPDLIVEIMSPDDRWVDIDEKLSDYFSIGVRLIWVANPSRQVIYAYRSLTDVREFTQKDPLPGDDVLPGFAVTVAHFFEE
jgi:Uma2 family endonuclease